MVCFSTGYTSYRLRRKPKVVENQTKNTNANKTSGRSSTDITSSREILAKGQKAQNKNGEET